MSVRLPPLNALKAFEAAARHLSFTLAAAELNVTQAAVSHQVKALEAHLGVKLFRRLPRALYLTEEGQALAPDLRQGFDHLASAVAKVGRRGAGGPLTVTLLTTFAMGWLLPRLKTFQTRHPEIEVRLSTTPRLVDFAREDIDCGIRNGHGNWPELYRLRLMDDRFTPLSPPEIAKQLKTPADLTKVVLLQTIGLPNEWHVWRDGAGFGPELDLSRGPMFDSTFIAVEAAIRGLGVAIGDPHFFAADLASGRLVQPFPIVVPMQKAWWFVCQPNLAERPKIQAFRDWLKEEAEAYLAARPSERME